MPKRYTVAEKWEDPWVQSLSAKAKLLWVYLCDVCDWAGFWEINYKRAAFDTGISERTIVGAFKELERGYERLDDRFVWIRNFIKHQGNFPLNCNNPAHKGIITLLTQKKELSESIVRILDGKEFKAPTKGLVSPIGNSKGKGKGKGKGKSYTEEFELFWKRWKGRWNADRSIYVKTGKFQAFEEWQKLSIEDQRRAWEVADKSGGKFTPDACRWLKNRRFDDFEKPQGKK